MGCSARGVWHYLHSILSDCDCYYYCYSTAATLLLLLYCYYYYYGCRFSLSVRPSVLPLRFGSMASSFPLGIIIITSGITNGCITSSLTPHSPLAHSARQR